MLGQIVSAGKIRIATDPNYAPFSFLNIDTQSTKASIPSTAEETVKRLSEKLGTEIKLVWETPSWDTITAGSWGGRWDISIGSMSVTVSRAKVVDFTEPYYYDSGSVAVPTYSTVQSLSDLNDGKTFCVGTATTYEQWLSGTLEIVDPNIQPAPTDPDVTALPTDNECIQAVQAGRTYDAIVANANGLPMRSRRARRSASSKARRSSPCRSRSRSTRAVPSTSSILPILNEIVTEMHADGTLPPCRPSGSRRTSRSSRSDRPRSLQVARPDVSSSGRAPVRPEVGEART